MRNQKTKKPTVPDIYDTVAERYEQLTRSNAYNAYCERPATLSLLPDVKGLRVLDAGCGSGFYTEWLVVHDADVVAIDGSPKMVELTKRRVEKIGKFVDTHQADLTKPLDFLENESLDIVLCPLVLGHIEDLKSIFAEFHRVLRKSGLLIFSLSHPTVIYMKYSGDDYFATELIQMPFSRLDVVIPTYRRPLSAILDPLWELDFVLERLIETRPTEECKHQHPEEYEKISKHPSFLCIRARKEIRK